MESWLGVEVRHLAALAAVNEERSFRGAADRLGYVQSAVSQQIAHLERLVGVRLVERARGHSRVELSKAGLLLLQHAEQILSQLGAAASDLQALADGGAATLRVGMYESLATRLLPRALTRLGASGSEVRVETAEAICDAPLFGRVESGELDAAFAELPLAKGPFEAQELLVDPLVLLVQADSPLARRGSRPELADLTELPFVVDPTWRMFERVEAEFGAAGLRLDRRFSASTNGAVQALVGAGLGVAVLPRLAVDPDDPTTEAIEMEGVLPARTLVLYWHRQRSHGAALDSFRAAVAEAAGELSAPVPPASAMVA